MDTSKPDYGADPIGDGTFRMVPSGDIVNREERDIRLKRKREVQNDCVGLSWEQIESRQGGRLNRKGSMSTSLIIQEMRRRMSGSVWHYFQSF